MSTRSPSRPFDVIGEMKLEDRAGATGFTGRLVVEYLLENGPKDLRVAMAGRSQSKLADVRDQLVERVGPSAATVPILIADTADQASIDAVASQTKVIITTVGPFAKYGTPVVDACIRMQTDYVDSTGEPQWIKEVVQNYHEEAVKNNVRIVCSCGFDSVPSDLATYLIADYFAQQGLQLNSSRLTLVGAKGGVSGGTLHSITNLLGNPLKAIDSPYSLVDKTECKDLALLPKPKLPVIFSYDRAFKRWQSYFLMESANTRYVLRTWSLLRFAYGKKFTYTEGMSHRNVLFALLVNLSLASAVLLLLPPVRWFVEWLAPSGTGPSDKAMRNGSFEVQSVGEAENGDMALATVKGIQDPGYRETAKMLSESALTLLDLSTPEAAKSLNRSSFPVLAGGVLTAASAGGMVLVERLRRAGMTLEVMAI
ncbi:Saccharopine dehydrogenase-domain-containing protein [Zopfochytrium polystomum]|nr:Saccharopine dehydrogenase-domain-containing protein [Zopfochytrium polystomum]